MVIGNRLHDISIAINEVAKANEFGNIRNFCGHGIGEKMHESPSVFNYVESREPNIRFQEGLVLALEPMFTLGTCETEFLDDKWTVVTADATNAAHWECSVAITKDGPRILGKNNEDTSI
jgi:methionyl aminopeptidase